jgi:hypothetical protein
MPDPLAGWPGARPPTEPARPVDARQAIRHEAENPDVDRDQIAGDDVSDGAVDDELVDAPQREEVR